MPSAARALDQYLSRVRLRSLLTEEEEAVIRRLITAGRMEQVEGDFVEPHSRSDHACLVASGLVGRFGEQDDGARHITALHIPGDMCDLHSVVASSITWALRAMTPSTILRIPHSAILEAATSHPALAVAFWRDCIADTTIISQWAMNIARKGALGRVAHMLCEMLLRYRDSGDAEGDGFPFPITQSDLADALGLTPIHLNRMLQRLKEQGLATKDRGRVTVHDLPQLMRVAAFNDDYLQREQVAVR